MSHCIHRAHHDDVDDTSMAYDTRHMNKKTRSNSHTRAAAPTSGNFAGQLHGLAPAACAGGELLCRSSAAVFSTPPHGDTMQLPMLQDVMPYMASARRRRASPQADDAVELVGGRPLRPSCLSAQQQVPYSAHAVVAGARTVGSNSDQTKVEKHCCPGLCCSAAPLRRRRRAL